MLPAPPQRLALPPPQQDNQPRGGGIIRPPPGVYQAPPPIHYTQPYYDQPPSDQGYGAEANTSSYGGYSYMYLDPQYQEDPYYSAYAVR